MNKGVQDFLSGRRNNLVVGDKTMDFRRPVPSPSQEPRQTITEQIMGHLPTREQLLAPQTQGRNHRKIDL